MLTLFITPVLYLYMERIAGAAKHLAGALRRRPARPVADPVAARVPAE
jgi:hypothetical protein